MIQLLIAAAIVISVSFTFIIYCGLANKKPTPSPADNYRKSTCAQSPVILRFDGRGRGRIPGVEGPANLSPAANMN